jgi:hypothetical protein
MMDANVGVRLREAIELQRESMTELERGKENNTESKANSYSEILPTWGCSCGSIYMRGQGSYYNALNALNHLLR